MTVFLRALWGPFGPFEKHAGTVAHEVRWFFFGIREDNTMGRWAVVFGVRTRKFAVANHALPKRETDPALVDAYVPDQPMIHGATYLAILKTRLPPEAITLASRLAIEAAR